MLFGDQLDLTALRNEGLDTEHDLVLLAEVEEEATHVPSHRQRTALFFSAMRHFAAEATAAGLPLRYVSLDEAGNTQTLASEAQRWAKRHKAAELIAWRPGEWRVLQELERAADALGLPLSLREEPHFYLDPARFAGWARGRKELLLEHFYRWMRKDTGVLMDAEGKPTGGQWNFDKDNRKPFRGALNELGEPLWTEPDAITQAVVAMVERHFPKAPGELESFCWPVTRGDAQRALRHFVEQRLSRFGPYQDAMAHGAPWMSHSLLSPLLNLKLLSPRACVRAAVDAYHRGKAPLASVEGFVRQILGWREFIRGIYWLSGPEYARRNHFDAREPLPEAYWTGDSEMACLQQCVGEVLRHGYGHHIQRLMITGNYALLNQVQPKALSDWYLGMYVDGVEWVTLPNTLGMALHADGGIVGTKPYAASGRYIQRMSDYCKSCAFDPTKRTGPSACPITRGYWRFLLRHEGALRGNGRMQLVLKHLDRIDANERRQLLA